MQIKGARIFKRYIRNLYYCIPHTRIKANINIDDVHLHRDPLRDLEMLLSEEKKMHAHICVTSNDIVNYMGHVNANHEPKYYLGFCLSVMYLRCGDLEKKLIDTFPTPLFSYT